MTVTDRDVSLIRGAHKVKELSLCRQQRRISPGYWRGGDVRCQTCGSVGFEVESWMIHELVILVLERHEPMLLVMIQGQRA